MVEYVIVNGKCNRLQVEIIAEFFIWSIQNSIGLNKHKSQVKSLKDFVLLTFELACLLWDLWKGGYIDNEKDDALIEY